MDFDDTPEEAAFRGEARAWLDVNAEPLSAGERREAPIGVAGRDSELLLRARAWQARKADAGWACLTWPVDYGGRGATPIQSVIFGQEEARYRVPPNLFTVGQGMLGPTIMAHGSEAQKQRYLPPMLRADEIWCQLFSEPAAGSDLAGLRMSAVREGESWSLSGQKIWTSGAHYSKWGMVLTRTDPDAPKHAGITYFIVDMESAGISIRPIRQINGASDFNEVFFDAARVPDANRVGAVNDGWRCALTTLMNERLVLGGGAGYGPGVRELIQLARETRWNGRPALEDAAVRQRIADLYVRAVGLEHARKRAWTALSRGQTPGPENAIGKLVGAPLRQELARFALSLQGSAGACSDAAAQPLGAIFQETYLYAAGLRLAGGSDEILRNIIAERVLGLPGEPRMDKALAFRDVPVGRAR
jgi:alkylation response protein AidB-like acyl-CoA dehydrogenase